MLVIDAGAVAELVLGRPAATRVAEHLVAHDFRLHAPYLVDAEVLSVVRRLVAAGEAKPTRGEAALNDFLDLPIARYPHAALLPEAWRLRENVSAYDALYVALAGALREDPVPLLTTDGRLARAVRAHTGQPVLLA